MEKSDTCFQWLQEVDTMQLLNESLQYWHAESSVTYFVGSEKEAKIDQSKHLFKISKSNAAFPWLWEHSQKIPTGLFLTFSLHWLWLWLAPSNDLLCACLLNKG
jgi:hypothetical protein